MSAIACASLPKAPPLTGVAAPPRLPATLLPSGHQRIVFDWSYRERVFSGRGQGVARIAPPDSVRLDFFLENGSAGGYVILIADSLILPPQSEAGRFVPPVPLLWGALGRLVVAATDTVARVDGDTLRADIGQNPTWRASFAGSRPRLVRLERIEGGRLHEWIARPDSTHIVYRHARGGRHLQLTVVRALEEPGFDASIWRP